jgi:hypothetical protein
LPIFDFRMPNAGAADRGADAARLSSPQAPRSPSGPSVSPSLRPSVPSSLDPSATWPLAPSPWTFRLLPAALCLLLLLSAGCAGYRFGHDSLYPPDVRTVYVPMFESNAFRRQFGERLTEAVVKEIELKTPFKVVGTPEADSVLSGRLVSETKRLTIESNTDEPRQSEVSLLVEVTWVDRRGDLIAQGAVPVPAETIDLTDTAYVVPEVGQSVATAHQAAIQGLAEQIVGLMEVPW